MNLTYSLLGEERVAMRASFTSILLLAMTSLAFAQDFTWTTNNGSITITGYIGPGGDVVTPRTIDGLPVEQVGNQSFYQMGSITSIVVSEGTKGIGTSAFLRCSNLVRVVVANTVTNVGLGAFSQCPNLATVVLGNGVISIGPSAFNGCPSLTNIVMPSSVSLLGGASFGSCSNLAGVFFKGASPFYFNSPQLGTSNTTVYYLAGTSGWGPTYDGRRTSLWNPEMETTDGMFGIGPSGFGFVVNGTTDIPIVVEASESLDAETWMALYACKLTNGSVYFSDHAWTNYPNRFYRIRSP